MTKINYNKDGYRHNVGVRSWKRRTTIAVHIVKSYCLPVLLYGCQIGKMSPSDRHKVDVAWNNCFRQIFNACWRESAKPLLFNCNTMSASFLADQRKIIFYKQTMCSGNIVLNTMCSLYQNDIRKNQFYLQCDISFKYCSHQTDNVVLFYAFDTKLVFLFCILCACI